MKSKTQGEQEKEIFFVVGSNGEIKNTPVTEYFPFPDYEKGFTAAETRRSPATEARDMVFQYGTFETSDPLQIEILRNLHIGCTIQTEGPYKGQILRPKGRLLYTITDKDPTKVGPSAIPQVITETKEVIVTKIPRVMIDISDVTVLLEVLKKERNIELAMPIEKDEVIRVLEEENLISD